MNSHRCNNLAKAVRLSLTGLGFTVRTGGLPEGLQCSAVWRWYDCQSDMFAYFPFTECVPPAQGVKFFQSV